MQRCDHVELIGDASHPADNPAPAREADNISARMTRGLARQVSYLGVQWISRTPLLSGVLRSERAVSVNVASYERSSSPVAPPLRSPATLPGYHAGRPPRNKGRRYPADPPTVEEIIAVMRGAGARPPGLRMRGLIVVLWRAGLRISEALALTEADLGHDRGSLLVRRGKGGRRREIGMDEWGWAQLRPWLEHRLELPIGPLFCIVNGPTAAAPWIPTSARAQLRRLAARAGVRRRFAPHQLRHAHAVEMAREGVPLNVIQRQLGHTDLGVTSVYLAGISNDEVISAVHARRAPMMPASAGLRFEA